MNTIHLRNLFFFLITKIPNFWSLICKIEVKKDFYKDLSIFHTKDPEEKPSRPF